LSQWLKEDGEYVKLDEPICEFESDKATLEFPAEAAGKLIYVAAEGDDLEIGAVVAKIDTSVSAEAGAPPAAAPPAETKKEEAPAPQPEAPVTPAESTQKTSYATGHPSPAAAKMMKEGGVSVAEVNGTGKDGRIIKEDVQKAIEAKVNAPATEKTAAPAASTVSAPTVAFSRETTRKKMSRMRRTIAKRLVSAKNGTAMLTTFNEVDLTEVMALRKKYQEQFVEKYGIKLGFMSLFAKACAKVLMDMPEVNAQIDGNELIYHDYVDISIAISTPNGLVVPPVHNVESLRFHEIELKIKELAGSDVRRVG
ncbi:MAG: 2-oxo acid dehydrogenase subunit E2, partial [Bacteroidota bacterium]